MNYFALNCYAKSSEYAIINLGTWNSKYEIVTFTVLFKINLFVR